MAGLDRRAEKEVEAWGDRLSRREVFSAEPSIASVDRGSIPAVRAGRLDPLFRFLTAFFAALILLLMAGILFELWQNSRLSLEKFGWHFLVSDAWNPVTQDFGALVPIFGTVVSTLLAMMIALPLSLGIALFLVEMAPPFLQKVIGTAVELLAAIPSIIYGMWGLFIFVPIMADHVEPWLGRHAGFLPFFKGPPMGIGMLTAAIILALMILPFLTSVARDIFLMVPDLLKESAYGMGSTTWEVTRDIVIPYGMRGLVGALFLGLGRALGETMAVTFVIGNSHTLSLSLFSAGNTIASTLANEFTEASGPVYLSSLVELGLILFLITFLVLAASQLWLKRITGKEGSR
ncbi:MAG: phosphate ABC transporter permease subunit PstC [Deltaproteobacteria bacterium]|nr:phosphate ABC transporter permease subunit PstC [Deltaproteobacteria bacterium]